MNTQDHHTLILTSYAKIHQLLDIPVVINNLNDTDCMSDFAQIQIYYISRQNVIEIVALIVPKKKYQKYFF